MPEIVAYEARWEVTEEVTQYEPEEEEEAE